MLSHDSYYENLLAEIKRFFNNIFDILEANGDCITCSGHVARNCETASQILDNNKLMLKGKFILGRPGGSSVPGQDSTRQGMVDGSASKPALRQDTG